MYLCSYLLNRDVELFNHHRVYLHFPYHLIPKFIVCFFELALSFFFELSISRIAQKMFLLVWFLLISIMFKSTIHIVVYIKSLFLLPGSVSLCEGTTKQLSDLLLTDVWVISSFFLPLRGKKKAAVKILLPALFVDMSFHFSWVHTWEWN